MPYTGRYTDSRDDRSRDSHDKLENVFPKMPQKNNMSLISLGEDGVTPILVKRILEPSNEAEAVTVTLNNLNGNTRSIAVSIRKKNIT